MCEIEIIAKATGVYFEKTTHYLVFFSDNKYDWQSHYRFHTLTIPPFDHPLHSDVLRHEVEHARFFQKFDRHPVTHFLWFFIFADWFLGAFEELWVSYQSQTINLKIKQAGFILWMCMGCVWIYFIIYGLFFSSNLLFILLGVLFGTFLVKVRELN